MKKIIVLVLVFVMLFSIVACATVEDDKPNNNNTDQVAEKIWDQKEYDFEEFEFVILGGANKGVVYDRDGSDLDADALTGNEVIDAVYNRNTLIEETYNCTIVHVESNSSSIQTALLTGTDEDVSLISIKLNTQFSYIEQQLLLDLYDQELVNLNLKAEWYNQNTLKDTTINGKAFCVGGDMLFTDENSTWMTLFNKELASRYLPEVNLYDLVREGKWTIDKMSEYAARATTELVADDKWTYKDQWGYAGEGANYAAHMAGFGMRLAEVTPDGGIKLNMFSEDFYDAYGKVISLFSKSQAILAQDIKDYEEENGYYAADAAFHEGRALFETTGMDRVIRFREMTTDFGIIPNPKLTESQELYYTWTTHQSPLVSLPWFCGDKERTSAIMEALFEESSYFLKPAHQERSLKYQGTRDDDSVEMLGIILGNTVYDIGVLYNFGGTYSELNSNAVNRGTGYVSTLSKLTTPANLAVEMLLKKLNKTT